MNSLFTIASQLMHHLLLTESVATLLITLLHTTVLFDYSAPDRGAEYCNERLCLSVSVCLSVHDHIFGTTCPIFTKFFMHVTYGRGWVLL